MISSHDSICVVDRVDALDGSQDRLQVAWVCELELESHLCDAISAGKRRARNDVDVFV
jgi:hypothetical protein